MRRCTSSGGRGSAFARDTAFLTVAYSTYGGAVASCAPSTSSPEVMMTGTPKRAAERAMIWVSVRSTPFTPERRLERPGVGEEPLLTRPRVHAHAGDAVERGVEAGGASSF